MPEDHEAALARIDALWDAAPGSDEADESDGGENKQFVESFRRTLEAAIQDRQLLPGDREFLRQILEQFGTD